jgi:hypothetical protein
MPFYLQTANSDLKKPFFYSQNPFLYAPKYAFQWVANALRLTRPAYPEVNHCALLGCDSTQSKGEIISDKFVVTDLATTRLRDPVSLALLFLF